MSDNKQHKRVKIRSMPAKVAVPQAKGYSEAGASHTRRAIKSFKPNSGSPIEDIDANNYTLRQRSRMLYMAAPITTSAVNTNRTKIVGVGLALKSSVNRDILGISAEEAKVWQRRTEAEFRLWAGKQQNCDAIGMNDFDGLQQLALSSWLLSGDVFALIKRYPPTRFNPYSLRIHLVEADRISTPSEYGSSILCPDMTEGKNPMTGNKIHDGVEIDASGRVVAYFIRNTYPFQTIAEETKWTRIEAYGENTGLANILQMMSSERPDQYRGVPYLAPVIEQLLQLRRYTESEMTAALVQSFFTAWIETTAGTTEMPLNEVGSGDVEGIPTMNPRDNISNSSNEYEMGPGSINVLEPGEKVNFGNPNIPSASFETFMQVLCRQIGAGLEIPYDVLMKEFNASYSASRAALLEAWEAFRMRRKWLIGKFVQPVYEMWLSEAIARGRIKAHGFWDDPLVREAWCGARWIGPVQGQLDPLKEAKASMLLVDNGIKTHEQVTREMGGGDWQENVEQLKRENELLKDAGAIPTSTDKLEPNNENEKGENDNDA